MKEASGELSMTVVTIIAIALILGLLYLMWPTINNKIQDTFTNATTQKCYDSNGNKKECES